MSAHFLIGTDPELNEILGLLQNLIPAPEVDFLYCRCLTFETLLKI